VKCGIVVVDQCPNCKALVLTIMYYHSVFDSQEYFSLNLLGEISVTNIVERCLEIDLYLALLRFADAFRQHPAE